jgi:hypothetical protein
MKLCRPITCGATQFSYQTVFHRTVLSIEKTDEGIEAYVWSWFTFRTACPFYVSRDTIFKLCRGASFFMEYRGGCEEQASVKKTIITKYKGQSHLWYDLITSCLQWRWVPCNECGSPFPIVLCRSVSLCGQRLEEGASCSWNSLDRSKALDTDQRAYARTPCVCVCV